MIVSQESFAFWRYGSVKVLFSGPESVDLVSVDSVMKKSLEPPSPAKGEEIEGRQPAN